MKRSLRLALQKVPWIKRLAKNIYLRMVPKESVSTAYVELDRDDRLDEASRLSAAWKSSELPDRQRNLVDRLMTDYRAGFPVLVFDALINSLKKLPRLNPGMSFLEIGCSSGYYSEVLKIAEIDLKYSGCDYSSHFIDMARKCYPDCDFSVEDATCLGYADNSFDIVVSGCCLLHIPEYQRAVCETVRVSREYVIFHRTPVVWGRDDQWYRKEAYGVETIEIHFNESKFLDLLAKNELEIISTYTLSEDAAVSYGQAVRTYTCRKLS